jgi:hypothetical protein
MSQLHVFVTDVSCNSKIEVEADVLNEFFVKF